MYSNDDDKHKLPHVHIKYAEHKASFCISDGNVLDGKLPPKQTQLVKAWILLTEQKCLLARAFLRPQQRLIPRPLGRNTSPQAMGCRATEPSAVRQQGREAKRQAR